MVIYTKRGDRGSTSLYDKASSQRDRVSKDSAKIRTIGSLDELNSYLGVVISTSEDSDLNSKLKEIQRNIFQIGSIIAGSKLRFFANKTRQLEKEIDELEGKLPVLKNFILPGGTETASLLQYSRALSRRAERNAVSLYKNELSAKDRSSFGRKPQILTYLNRLSDYLFMQARNVNHKNSISEEVWVGGKH